MTSVTSNGSPATAGNRPADQELCFTDATVLAQRIAGKEISAREVMQAFLQQIDTFNPSINAVCTRIPEENALELADRADLMVSKGEPLGPLHGLPIAVKDLALTKGVRTTFGSLAFADHVPEQDSLIVERLKQAGAIIIGKTNTPEFGAGSNTFNSVFGVTANPYNLDKTAGGSSGGAAAALAAGMLPIADGSDMGGSLRNPAAFCNVVGLRPSLGRVPTWPNPMLWHNRLGVEGPMARNVSDCALLLSVLAGPDPRDPLSIQESGEGFRQSLAHDFKGARIAWTPNLGSLPVEKAVIEVCESSLTSFTDIGFEVEPACPDLQGAMDLFKILRASFYAQACGNLLKEHRDLLKDTLVENIELGLGLSSIDVTAADAQRSLLYHNLLAFFEHYDFLVLPTTQVQPFDHRIEWVREIEGTKLHNYLDWMSICCIISIFGLPAISVPCGFTPQGLPVGLQIVGKPQADLDLLRAAYAYEQATGWAQKRP